MECAVSKLDMTMGPYWNAVYSAWFEEPMCVNRLSRGLVKELVDRVKACFRSVTGV